MNNSLLSVIPNKVQSIDQTEIGLNHVGFMNILKTIFDFQMKQYSNKKNNW